MRRLQPPLPIWPLLLLCCPLHTWPSPCLPPPPLPPHSIPLFSALAGGLFLVSGLMLVLYLPAATHLKKLRMGTAGERPGFAGLGWSCQLGSMYALHARRNRSPCLPSAAHYPLPTPTAHPPTHPYCR